MRRSKLSDKTYVFWIDCSCVALYSARGNYSVAKERFLSES